MKLGVRESSTFLPWFRGRPFCLFSNHLYSVDGPRIAAIPRHRSYPSFPTRPTAAPHSNSRRTITPVYLTH